MRVCACARTIVSPRACSACAKCVSATISSQGRERESERERERERACTRKRVRANDIVSRPVSTTRKFCCTLSRSFAAHCSPGDTFRGRGRQATWTWASAEGVPVDSTLPTLSKSAQSRTCRVRRSRASRHAAWCLCVCVCFVCDRPITAPALLRTLRSLHRST